MIIGSAAASVAVAVVGFFIFAFIVIFLKSCLKVVQQGCVGVVKRFGEFRTIKQPGPARAVAACGPHGQGGHPRVPPDR